MRFPTTEGVYRRLPVVLQDVAVSVQGARVLHHRHGRKFEAVAQGYFQRDSWPEERIIEFRNARRAEALQRASCTPYYRDLFASLDAHWQDFVADDMWQRLPIITKSDLLQGIDRFRPRLPRRDDSEVRTSGTTGVSLSMPKSENVDAEQWAVWWRYWGWHGIERGDWCGLFSSTPVVFDHGRATRPWRINLVGREVRFSIFHISEDTVPAFMGALERFKPEWIHGNPSAVALFASLACGCGASLSYQVKNVTVGSENLQSWQEDAIVAFFGVQPRQHYGLTEAVANLSECEQGSLHVDEDFAYVEFLPDASTTANQIVGTSFCNSAVSLLRYATGDLAVPATGMCACGRAGRVVESLDGRLTDYVVLPDGRRVASLAAPFHATEGLGGAQIHQSSDGSLTISYVPTERWRQESLADLESGLRLRIGHHVPIRFVAVGEIPRTQGGKTRLVVSDYME